MSGTERSGRETRSEGGRRYVNGMRGTETESNTSWNVSKTAITQYSSSTDMHLPTSTHTLLLLLRRVPTNISLLLLLIIITDPTTTMLFTTIILSHRVPVEVKQFLLCPYRLQGQCRVLALVLVTMSPTDHILQMS